MLTCWASQDNIDKLFKEKTLTIIWDDLLEDSYTDERTLEFEPYPNECFILKSTTTNSSAIVRYLGDDQFKLIDSKIKIDSIRPKDSEQTVLMDLLTDSEIKILTVTGLAGSGKSLVSLAYGITSVMKQKDMTLYLTKPAETVGNSKFFGAVPGGNDEKFQIFLESFDLSMRKILAKDTAYIDVLKANERIIYKPIEFCRGDSRENTILILDESQNVNWHALKTLLTRFGENCKVIMLGDTRQKDIKQNEQSGFELLYNSKTFKESKLTAHIELINDWRGPISRIIQLIDDEMRNMS